MFHVISAILSRLARRIEDRLAIPDEYAAWYGWSFRQVGPRTREYRDPRFAFRKFALTETSTGCEFCDGKIAQWLFAEPGQTGRWS
jgi:hypothetical protein